jgi:DNA polymerase I-like protein with 3'-5' exonuclease and polymerase domains
VLAVQYGMGAESLALRIGESKARGRELLGMHREAYPVFWRWSDAAVDKAMIEGTLGSVFGWKLKVASVSNPRSLRNFPMQSNGAEMMRLAMILMTRNSIKVLAPVHDAFLVECETKNLQETLELAEKCMGEASRLVLDGFELDSDAEVFSHPERFGSPGPGSFFIKVVGILERIEGASNEGTHLPQGQGRMVPPSYSFIRESV